MSILPDWLRLRSNGNEDEQSNDSSYEDEVIERCDHEFEQSSELLSQPAFNEGEIIGDHIVIPQYQRVEEYCVNCGEPGYKGEPTAPFNEDYTYAAAWDGVYTEVAHRLAIPIERLNPGDDPKEVLSSDDGTVIEGEGEGRVIVNESEQEAAASDDPVAAGGPTDD